MRLELLNCPNCHAPLDYSPGQTLCICLYCNSTIRIHHDTSQPAATTEKQLSTADMAEIKELLLAGQMDTAVQRYQQIAHCHQSEAQAAIATLSNQISFKALRQQQLSRGGLIFFVILLVGLAWALVGGLTGQLHPVIAIAITVFALLYIALFGKGFLISLRYLRAANGVATVQHFTRISSSQTGRRTFHLFRIIVEVQPEPGAPFQMEMLLPVRDRSVDKLHQGTRFGVKFLPGDENSVIFNKLLPEQ
ncbi:MAG: hypothetical protein HND44_04115 [Chloroflexi bacterium]|nr:hypothetical protein [Ardenticatenaceae bacterium]MBL1127686.1 hypothetical protein [Chloroflexota bacterium]NOG33751.1 hypothetical protein [Chloroflexota bacterium]GIK56072.1 MAG: hypothetical protein BroJett015_17350 [Chloroflexota bacterium]